MLIIPAVTQSGNLQTQGSLSSILYLEKTETEPKKRTFLY